MKYNCNTKKFYITIRQEIREEKGVNMKIGNILEEISEVMDFFFTTIEYMMLRLSEKVL